AAAARPVRHAGRGGRLGDAAGPGPAAGHPRSGRFVSGLRGQLVADRPAQLLLRAVRPAHAAGPPVVAGGGGAVLPDLALAAAARAPLGARPAPHPHPAPGGGAARGRPSRGWRGRCFTGRAMTRRASTTAPTPGPLPCSSARRWPSSGPAATWAATSPKRPA